MFRCTNIVVATVLSATFAFSAPAHATFKYGFIHRVLDRLEEGKTPEQICEHFAGYKYRSETLAGMIDEADDDDVRGYRIRQANMHRRGHHFLNVNLCVHFVTKINNISPVFKKH